MNKTKNAMRNIIFGMGLRIYQIIVPFLMRTAMIYFMGIEYLGLNSLFTSSGGFSFKEGIILVNTATVAL